jgi:hypothetical protein
MEVANPLAYYNMILIMSVKGFIQQVLRGCNIKLFMSVIVAVL